MSFDIDQENFDMRDATQLDAYLASEPQPQACEDCWQRWERKLNVGSRAGQLPMSVALRLYERPDFSATCQRCVAEFEMAVAQHLANVERYLSVA